MKINEKIMRKLILKNIYIKIDDERILKHVSWSTKRR